MQCGIDDVMVCDICGDIGDEEKLVICSGCNDGAEHIYCMQVMIENVPEDDWFCEECRADVDTKEKRKKLEISQVKDGLVSSKDKAGIEHVAIPNGRIKKRRELKLCGICGDVGKQEKLAVCDRCNEDAEHIYCMQVMTKKVPDVGWLCEACQSEVEAKKTNELQNSQAKDGIFEGRSAEGQPINPGNNANIIISSKNQMDHKYVGGKESEVGTQDNYMVNRKKEAEAGATSSVRQNLHESINLSVEGQLSKSVSLNNSKFPKVNRPTLARSASLKKANFGDLVSAANKTPMKIPVEETRVMSHLGSQNVKNNRGSSISYNSVSASMVTPLASQAESPGHYELKKSLSVKATGSSTLSSAKRSAGFLGPDPKRRAVQVSHHSHEDCNTNNQCLMLKVKGYDSACMAGRSLDSHTMSSDLGDKNLVFYDQDFSPGYVQMASAIPEIDYFWQGSFELWGTGILPEFCDGLQGHISCSASPELLKVAKTFPSKIQLQQLPRRNVSPSEFQENYSTCDRIDIFFFARDIQSYGNYYSKLVGNLMKDDLALRGNTETAELIIFSSSTLPKIFQTWNMLYFLWGVLRVKREDPLNLPPGPPDKHH